MRRNSPHFTLQVAVIFTLIMVMLLALFAPSAHQAKIAYAVDSVVHNTNDSGTGSLRDVVNTVPSGTTITFDPTVFNTPQTITLTTGVITISQNLTIQGPGSSLIKIDGNNASRIFSTQASATVTVSGVTLQHGFGGNSPNLGGAIDNLGTLTIVSSVLTANSAGAGGGIVNRANATLTIQNSTFTGNITTATGGGGSGGAIVNYATLTVTGSTFSGNIVADYGGALYNGIGTATIANSTFAGNQVTSTGAGGAIRNDATLNIYNSTFTGNSSGFTGSFLYLTGVSGANTTVRNSIIAGNTGGSACYLQGGSYTGTLNNMGSDTSCTGIQNVGTAALQLGSLANNGGTTQTIALGAGSVAINAGDNTTCAASPVNGVDQRGYARVGTCDIGAYEYGAGSATATPTATNTSIPPSATNTPLPPTATNTQIPPTITPVLKPDGIGCYDPLTSTFYLRNSLSSGTADFTVPIPAGVFGNVVGDVPVVGDWNGDGVDTVGIYRRSNGFFLLSNSNTTVSLDYAFVLGNPNDIPLHGRWTPDMTADGAGAYRPSNGVLYIKKALTTGVSNYFAILGNPGDIGVAGDWDGDGYASTGVYRVNEAKFYLTNNSTPAGITFANLAYVFGSGAGGAGNPYVDISVMGDWDGNGSMTGGVYNPQTGAFYLRNTNTAGTADITFSYCTPGNIPVAGRWIP